MQSDAIKIEIETILQLMYRDYPDVVNVNQLCIMLGNISTKSAYKLLHTDTISYFKIGRTYKIPKIHVIVYLSSILIDKSRIHFRALPH